MSFTNTTDVTEILNFYSQSLVNNGTGSTAPAVGIDYNIFGQTGGASEGWGTNGTIYGNTNNNEIKNLELISPLDPAGADTDGDAIANETMATIDTAFDGVDCTGKAVLIQRGAALFAYKALKAQQAGAKLVILYNSNAFGDVVAAIGYNATYSPDVVIPVVMIGNTIGERLVNKVRGTPGSLYAKYEFTDAFVSQNDMLFVYPTSATEPSIATAPPAPGTAPAPTPAPAPAPEPAPAPAPAPAGLTYSNAPTNTIVSGYDGTISGTLVIPEGVTQIAQEAFYQRSDLTSITLPSTLQTIGLRAFANSGLTSVVIPNSVGTLGAEAFKESALSSLTLGTGLTSIGNGSVFHGTSLTSVLIPANIGYIGPFVFAYCYGLTTVTFAGAEGSVSIASNAFQGMDPSPTLVYGGSAPAPGPAPGPAPAPTPAPAPAPAAGTPTTLIYSDVVDVSMADDNDVNFADVEDYGHRVSIEVDKTKLNEIFKWSRAIGAARPSAVIGTTSGFRSALITALGSSYTDIDGVTGGLHFGSANLSTNTDERIRKNGAISANDIPLAFVLYKLYGNSTVNTLDNIFNLQDAHDMLSNESVADAIIASLETNESGSVDVMFRDLLAADPHRFFNSSGIPDTGIFETRTDISGAGSWKITNDDVIEVKTKLVFNSKVTRRGVAGNESNITSSDGSSTQNNQQTIISPGDYFYIRLQMKAATI